MKKVNNLMLIIFCLVFISCKKERSFKLEDKFLKEWENKTYNKIKLISNDDSCVKVLKKSFSRISFDNLREKSVSKLNDKLIIYENQKIIIEESFFNHGVNYGFSLFINNKEYALSFEGDFITRSHKLNNKTFSLDFVSDRICDDILLKSQEKTSISIVSVFKQNKNKLDLLEQYIR